MRKREGSGSGSGYVPLTNGSGSRRPKKTCGSGSGSPTLEKRIGNWTTQKDEKVREINSFGINNKKRTEARLQKKGSLPISKEARAGKRVAEVS
jgi:hypothetical protein